MTYLLQEGSIISQLFLCNKKKISWQLSNPKKYILCWIFTNINSSTLIYVNFRKANEYNVNDILLDDDPFVTLWRKIKIHIRIWILHVKTAWFKLKKMHSHMIWRFVTVVTTSLMKAELSLIMKRGRWLLEYDFKD